MHCLRLQIAAEPKVAHFDEVLSENERFLEEFDKTRPDREVYLPERSPGKGRTGREEWT